MYITDVYWYVLDNYGAKSEFKLGIEKKIDTDLKKKTKPKNKILALKQLCWN